jgi:hypothetical protein
VGQATFDTTLPNWNAEIRVGIEARDDSTREDPQVAVIKFERGAGTTDPNYEFPNLRSGLQLLDVDVIDNETSGAVVLESGGSTVLVPNVPAGTGENDDYTIRLTRKPTDNVSVAVLTDGLADVISIGGAAVNPNDYVEVGGFRPTQVFSGFIVFGDNGTQSTLTRGTGADLGSFIDEGFHATATTRSQP